MKTLAALLGYVCGLVVGLIICHFIARALCLEDLIGIVLKALTQLQ